LEHLPQRYRRIHGGARLRRDRTDEYLGRRRAWNRWAARVVADAAVAEGVNRPLRHRIVRRAQHALREKAGDRVALFVVLIGKAREHDWRQTAHVFDAIVGGCHARADVPADVAATERGRVHAELDAVIADAADIDELRIRESTRRCCA